MDFVVAAIIFGKGAGPVIRAVRAESLANLAAMTVLNKGEDIIILRPDEIETPGLLTADEAKCYEIVEKHIGRPAARPQRCVALDENMRAATVFVGSPALDMPDGRLAVADDLAVLGDELLPDGKFYRETPKGLVEIEVLKAEENAAEATAEVLVDEAKPVEAKAVR